MPLPKSKNPGTIIKFLKKDKPGMPHKQKVAIAMHQTGKGANMKKMASKMKKSS